MAYCVRMPSKDVDTLIEEAIHDHLVLRMTYKATDGTEAVLLVEPLAIRFNVAKHRVLWCWSRDAGHIEELIWDGIEDAATTGGTFAPRPWIDPDAES